MISLKTLFSIFALFLFALPLTAQSTESANGKEEAQKSPREFEMKEGDTTYVMKRYVFVHLMRGDKAHDFTEAELQELQKGHMDNMNRLAEIGKLQVAGPMGEDGDLRGILIMDCEDIEEAKTLVDTDPAVKAGRLRAEYHTWWGAKGTTLK